MGWEEAHRDGSRQKHVGNLHRPEMESALQVQDQQQTDRRLRGHRDHHDREHRSQPGAEPPKRHARQLRAGERVVWRVASWQAEKLQGGYEAARGDAGEHPLISGSGQQKNRGHHDHPAPGFFCSHQLREHARVLGQALADDRPDRHPQEGLGHSGHDGGDQRQRQARCQGVESAPDSEHPRTCAGDDASIRAVHDHAGERASHECRQRVRCDQHSALPRGQAKYRAGEQGKNELDGLIHAAGEYRAVQRLAFPRRCRGIERRHRPSKLLIRSC